MKNLKHIKVMNSYLNLMTLGGISAKKPAKLRRLLDKNARHGSKEELPGENRHTPIESNSETARHRQ